MLIKLFGKKMRIRSIAFQKGLLGIMLFLMTLSIGLTVVPEVVAQTVGETTTEKAVPLSERLVQLQISQIGFPSSHGSGATWKPAWNEIRAEIGVPPLIVEADIKDLPPIEDSATGTTLFHRTVPFDFDMNVWSSLTAGDAMGSSSGLLSDGTKTWATVKIYKGEGLTNTQGNYKTWVGDNPNVDISTAIPIGMDNIVATGNDGNDRFDTREATFMTTVTTEYYKLLGEKYSPYDKSWFWATLTDFEEIKTALGILWGRYVDYNNFNVNVTLVIDPLTMPSSIDTETGTISYKGSWLRFGGAIIKQGSQEQGYCATPTRTALALNDGLQNSQITSSDGSEQKPQAKEEQMPNINQNTGGSISGHIEYSAIDQPATPVSQDLINTANQLVPYSLDYAYKDYQTCIMDEVKDQKATLNDKLNWELSFKNFRLTPFFYLIGRQCKISSQEHFIDVNCCGAKDVDQATAVTTTTPKYLVGWYIKNVYVHFRVRIFIDVYCLYQTNIIHDGGDNSYLGTPIDVNGKMIFDKSMYGAKNFNYTWDDPTIGKWWDNLTKGIDFAKYLPWIIVAVLAIAALYVVGQSGIIGGGRGGGGKTNVSVRTGEVSGRPYYSPQGSGQSGLVQESGNIVKWVVYICLAIAGIAIVVAIIQYYI